MNPVFTKQQRIAELAQQSPEMAFTSLAYHMDLKWLYEAFNRTRKDGAAGVDGVTVADYAQDLDGNLQRLLDRAKSGSYRAPPVRRVHIPKGDGKETRPLGIPSLEDKILQRAVVMLLEPIYEHDFSDSSFGYRPQRSAHDALDMIRENASEGQGGWILEVDIRKFFDTLDHGHLRELLGHRIRDGVLLRLLGKWLRAGVLEDGNVSYPDSGSPQGGVISPLLANIYLHYVLDVWFEQEVRPRLRGRTWLTRYADDFVMGFHHESDAHRVYNVLSKRFAKYGLTIHPDKTRLLAFQRPPTRTSGKDSSSGRPDTFDFLGFTHYMGRNRRGQPGLAQPRPVERVRLQEFCEQPIEQINLRLGDGGPRWLARCRHSPAGSCSGAATADASGFGFTGAPGL